jgi:hypothetical protein
MKKGTLTLLTAVAAVSMAGIAHAVPFGVDTSPPGLQNQGGSPQGLTNQGGASASGLGVVTGLPTGGNNPLVASPLISVSTVPEGSSLILLGAAFFTLALFGRRLQSSF